MSPNTIKPMTTHDHTYFLSLLLVTTMLSPTLKVLISLKGKPVLNPAHTASAHGINIAIIGEGSAHVSIMGIAPANALIHSKWESFEHTVWQVSTLKWLHTSSEWIHFMSQHLPVNTNYPPPLTLFVQATGKYHSYNSYLNYVSHYLIVFIGCYACGQEDHNQTDYLPLNRSS